MLHETNHHTRVIPTDGRPHISQNIRQWQGDSVGRWEGNTLVVDTTNFTGLTANFRGSGEKLHLVERFTRVSDDTLMYQFTVEDPTTWAKPWTAEIPMTKTQGPVYEWACHEGNNMIVEHSPRSPCRRRGSGAEDSEVRWTRAKGATDENKAIRHGCGCWPASGGGASVGSSRVCGGIRHQQAAQVAGNGHQMAGDQSALLDSHRRQGPRRQGGPLDDRRRQPEQLCTGSASRRSPCLPGTEIVVDGFQAKDLSNKAVGRNITLPNGKKLFLGGSAPGAGGDGADETGRGERPLIPPRHSASVSIHESTPAPAATPCTVFALAQFRAVTVNRRAL